MRKSTMSMAIALAGMAAIAATVGPASAATAPNTKTGVLYSSLVSPLPGNLPSQPFQAQQTAQFGNEIKLTKAGHLTSVVVTMSSWGCQHGGGTTCTTTKGATFPVSITLNLYQKPSSAAWVANVPVVPGSPILSDTKTFNIPFRPSASPSCSGGGWGPSCFNGFANNITFSLDHSVPQTLVFGIVYNTSQYGPAPNGCDLVVGANCPIDSLNVGLTTTIAPSKGSDPYPGTAFWNTATASDYCDSGAAGANIFRLDSPGTPCWAPYSAAVQFIGY
jgi:hypothetical protein